MQNAALCSLAVAPPALAPRSPKPQEQRPVTRDCRGLGADASEGIGLHGHTASSLDFAAKAGILQVLRTERPPIACY
jgi:hypothetical protein